MTLIYSHLLWSKSYSWPTFWLFDASAMHCGISVSQSSCSTGTRHHRLAGKVNRWSSVRWLDTAFKRLLWPQYLDMTTDKQSVCMNGKIRVKLSNTTSNVNSINTEIELDFDILKKIISPGWLQKFEHLCTVK